MNRASSKILISVIIIVLAAGGFFAWHYFGTPKTEVNKCEEIQNLGEQSKCYTDLAKEVKNETWCEKINIPEAPEVKSNCYVELAILKNNPSICWEVETASLSSACWEHFGMKEWKIYKNGRYGYEIKYPSDWEIDSKIPWGGPPWWGCEVRKEGFEKVTFTNLSPLEKEEYFKKLRDYDGIGSAEYRVYNADGRTIRIAGVSCSVDELLQKKEVGWEMVKLGEETMGNLKIIRTQEIVLWEMERDHEVVYISFPKELEYYDSDDKKTKYMKYIAVMIERNNGNYEKEAFNQMLSTFRFIEAEETADWRIYRNEEYEFEMRYPRDWEIQVGEKTINFVQGEGQGIVIISKPPSLEEAISELKQFISDNPDNVINVKEEKILLDGVSATRISFKVLYLRPMSGPGWSVEIFVNEDKNLQIYFQTTFTEEYLSVFNQMLSTFRFLE